MSGCMKEFKEDLKIVWARIRELWAWTRNNPKADRTELEQEIVKAYKKVLLRWLLGAFSLFLLTGLVKFFWHIWGKIFDCLLALIGF